MNYTQIGILFLQATLISFVILLLFRLRKQLGIGVLFACLGLIQFLQVYLSNTVYISVTDNLIVSPGSSVLFTATLFALLIIYIKEDASETKKMIYALFIVNILISVCLQVFGWSLEDTTDNSLNASIKLFDTSSWVLFIRTLLLFIDSLIIILVFEFISKKIRFLFLQICLTMLIVVGFDAISFSLLFFWNSDNLSSILLSGLISKGVFVIFYSIPFYFYIRYFDSGKSFKKLFNLRDVFQPLTYKQKFESITYDIKKAEEKYDLELVLANKEKRIKELELSEQKLQYSLELLEKKDHSLKESSRVAKIGHWEYDIATDVFIWSEYIYEMYGLDLNDKIPSRNEIIKFYDEDSQKKLAKATQDLTEKGIPYDIELKLINKRNEEIWVRNVVQLIHNQQNEILGRRGFIYNITDSKRAQLEIQLSQQKIKTSLELLKNKEIALHKISSIAKIGYWEYSIDNVNAIWSDYHYEIFGLNPKDGIPPREKLLSYFDEKSQEKIEKANLKLHTEGIAFDIEVRLINQKNKEVWVRNVVQPVYNQQNKVIGRRGLLQDITETKKAQLELELSKQKIQESLELLEKRKYSMDEAGKLAKIGYWDVNTENNTSIWSDYVHYAIGSNPREGIPDQSIVQKYLSKESFELFTKSTKEITLKGTPYDIEINFKNLKNEKVWIRVIAQPVFNQQNKIIGRRGLLQNITASKKAEEKIQESLNLLENSKYSMDEASKIAKIGYFEHNMVTDTFKWSDYLFNIHGFDPKKPVPPNKEFIKYLDQESLTVLNNAVLNLTTKGVSYDIEMKIFNKIKNKNIWVRSVAQPIYNDKNEIIGRRGVTQDITTAKNAQQELELSKQKIQESLELLERRKYSMDEASKIAKIGYWDHDIENEYVSWSDYVHTIFGSNPEEGIPAQNSLLEKFSKRSQEQFVKVSQDLLLKGQPYDVELKYNNPKKGVVWIRSVAQPIYNQQNKIIGKRGVLQDITNEKNTELKLRENEEKFFNIFKNSPNLIILTRLKDYKIVDANDAAFRVTGYTPEEIINNSNFPKHVWTSLDNREKYFEKLIKNGKIKNYETEFVIKSGEIRFWKTSSQIIKISNEKYALSTIEDVTDIKEAQVEIQKQTEFINAMTENQPSAVIACNSEGELVFFNKKAIEWHGVDVLKIPSDKWVESYGLYKADGETKLKTEEIPLMQAFKGQKIRNLEIVIKVKNQKPRTIICSGTSFSDADGNILGAVIVMNDVTTQKQTENNLKRSESETKIALKEIERSEFLLNESGRLAKVGAWEMKLPSQEILWSKEVFAIHGLPVGKVPPFEDCVGYYVDGSAEILAKAVEKSIAEKKKFDLVLKFNNEKKQKLWVHTIGYPITNEEGEITSLIGVFQDITEQKNRRIKLDEQNEKLSYLNNALNEAQEISHLGSWEYIVATDKVTWSKELLNIFERSSELGAPNYAEHKVLYPEESFTKMNNAVANCIENEIPYNLELEIYTSKGSLKHIVSRGKAIKDKNNKVIGCYGTVQDITEQKQIRLKVEETEKMYRILTDYSNDLISLQKPDGTFEYVSPAVKNLLGYEPSEFLGEKVFSLVHKDDIKRIKKTIEERMLKGVFNEPVSFRVVHKNGHYVWLEFLSSPVYKDNEISYFVTSSRDITQWVLAQKEIQEYQKSLQKLTTEITLIEERQKKDIASNIHDHLSQSLVISNMRIKELKKNTELKAINDDLNFISEHISEALANSRKITSELSPPILYQLGIIEALYDLLENIEKKHKIKHQINDNTNGIELSEMKSILVYRSIQELFNNIIKYAEATLITIDINKNELGVDIFIRDNGVGFDTEKLNNLYHHNEKGSGFGLFTVKERIRNIQGEFKITSKINKGTTVTIFIPINE